MSSSPDAPPSPAIRPAPLTGVRILDFTTVLAGPYSTYQLALLGADVIKVERPGGGDWARQGAPVTAAPEFSAQFVAQNGDKRSVVIDLQSPAGMEQALALAATSDVVVEDFAPGVAERLGLGFDAVRARKPDIVYGSISGFGQDGPLSARPAYDHVIQAASGVTMLTGTPQTVPNRIGPPMVDYIAGIYGAFALLAALRERDRTGQAQRIDLAMLDAALAAMASTVSAASNGGTVPRAQGNTAASGSPLSGIFPTGEGLLAIAANNPRQADRVLDVLGLSGWREDPRFSTAPARLQHVEALQARVRERLATRTAAEWEQVLSAAHVPAARVRTVVETLAEPHVRTRGVQQPVHDPVSGATLLAAGIGFKWNGQALGPRRPPPRLGEHDAELLGSPSPGAG